MLRAAKLPIVSLGADVSSGTCACTDAGAAIGTCVAERRGRHSVSNEPLRRYGATARHGICCANDGIAVTPTPNHAFAPPLRQWASPSTSFACSRLSSISVRSCVIKRTRWWLPVDFFGRAILANDTHRVPQRQDSSCAASFAAADVAVAAVLADMAASAVRAAAAAMSLSCLAPNARLRTASQHCPPVVMKVPNRHRPSLRQVRAHA